MPTKFNRCHRHWWRGTSPLLNNNHTATDATYRTSARRLAGLHRLICWRCQHLSSGVIFQNAERDLGMAELADAARAIASFCLSLIRDKRKRGRTRCGSRDGQGAVDGWVKQDRTDASDYT